MLAAFSAVPVTRGAPSALDGFDPNVSGYVDAVVVQPDGGIVLGGAFTMVGGQPRNRLARVGRDGVLDPAFNPGASDVVDALALQPDGRILLGGAFTAIAGQARVHFARLQADGSLDDTLNPGVDGNVAAIVVQPDGGIIIGGTFTTVAGQPRANLARFAPDGSLDAAFNPGPNSYVRALAVQADGRILLGGDFTSVAGQARSYLARLLPDGSLDATFAAAPNGAVNTITALVDGRVFIGGSFLQVSDVPHNYLARLLPDGALDASVTLNANIPVLTSAQLPDGEVVFGGYFTTIGGVQRERLAAVTLGGTLSSRFETFQACNNLVRTVAPQDDGRVVVGGNFNTFAGVTRNALARVCRDGSLDATLSSGSSGTVNTIALQADTRILVGGSFTSIGGINRLNFARLRASGQGDMSFGPNPNNTVHAVVVQPDEKIVFGGLFSSGSGWGRSLIARLFPDSTLDAAFNANASGVMVSAFALQPDGAIVLGGQIFFLAGQPRNFIARLHADGSLDPAFNPGASDTVLSLALQSDGGILVGGTFTTIAGQPRERLARLDATGALDPTFNPGANGPVLAMAVQPDGRILLAGSFTTVAGAARDCLARLNADGSLDDTFVTGANSAVNTIAVQTDGAILVGGAFTNLGGGARSYLARLNPDGSPDVSFTAGTNGPVNAITVQDDGRVLVGGQFGQLAGETRVSLGRLAAMAPAAQELLIDDERTTVTWRRDGPGPELVWVRFEQSTDGVTWSDLGLASRVGATSDWSLSGLTLPVTNAFLVRARGIAPSSQYGSSGIIETVRQFAPLVPPEIVTQPADQVAVLGDTAIFQVVVSGTPPLGYQWKKDGVDLADGGNVSGVWSPTLTLTNVQPGDAGPYHVVIVNAVGGTTSADAMLTVNLPAGYPAIATQPRSTIVTYGAPATFAVAATGMPEPDFQWYRNGAELAGETGPSLVLADVQAGDLGAYVVTVANSLGMVTSEPAFLLSRPCTRNGHTYEHVRFPIEWNEAEAWAVSRGGHLVAIDDQAEHDFLQGFFAVSGGFWIGLSDQAVEGDWSTWSDGAPATFSGWHAGEPNDSGDGEDFAQMYWDASLGGARWNDIPDVSADAVVEYPFEASVPAIAVPPVDQAANPGDDVSFCISVTGELMTYQWYRDGVAIPGATGPCLELHDVGIADVGAYHVVATNPYGSVTSDPVALGGTASPPVITTQPENLTVTSGDPATFTVASTAALPAYQWRRNGVPIAGANNASCTINSAVRADADWYDVVVFDGLTTTTSATVRLSVAPTNYPGLLINDPVANLLLTRPWGRAHAVAMADDGAFYVGGDFVSIDGQPRSNLARFQVDGSVDAAFLPPKFNGAVSALLVLEGGRVVVGGDFYGVAGATRTYTGLVCLAANGEPDDTMLFPGVNGSAFALTRQPDGRILVGGNFGGSDGTPSVLARFHADGTLDDSFSSNVSGGHLRDIFVQPDGRLMIGGWFTHVDGQPRNCVARLNADGSLDPTFDPGSGADSEVQRVQLLGDGRYIMAGGFRTYAGASVSSLVRLEANGALDPGYAVGNSLNGGISDVVVLPGDGLVVVGSFDYASLVNLSIAGLNADGTLDPGFFASSNGGSAYALARQSDGRLVVAGDFSSIGGGDRQSIARLTADGLLDASVAPTTIFAAQIRSMAHAPDGKLVVAGNFTAIDGVAANRVARILADGSVDSTFDVGAGPNGDVGQVVVTPEGSVVIVGAFTSVDGVSRGGVARLNPDGSLDPGYDAGIADSIWWWEASPPAVTLPGGRVVIATNQPMWGGVPVHGLLALKPDGTRDLDFDIGSGFDPSYSIMALAAQGDGKVLVGGSFTEFNGQGCHHLVRLNLDGSLDASFDVGSGDDGDIRAIVAQPDGRIVVAGGFTVYDGVPRSHAARLNPDGSLDPTFDPPGMNNNISLLLSQEDGRFIVGGNFTSAGNAPNTTYLARLEADGSLDPSFQVAGQTSIPEVLALTDDGTLCSATFSTPANNDGLVRYVVGTPVISIAPEDAVASPGDTVTFTVGTSGDGLSFQWFKDGVALAGETNATLILADVQWSDLAAYTVTVSNAYFSVTTDAVTIVGENPPPTILTQPDPVTAIVGTEATATVVASGVGALTYQWNKFGVPIAGATNATLTLPACEMADAGRYDVMVYDGFSFTRSAATRVTVAPTQYLEGDLRIVSVGPQLEKDDAWINAVLVLPDGRYYAAGEFTEVNGHAQGKLARFTAAGAVDPTFVPVEITGLTVNALARQDDGKLIVGGAFSRVNGVPRSYVARLLENGALDANFDPGEASTDSVLCLAVQPDGRVLVGGYGANADTNPGGRVVRLLSDGSRDETFDAGAGFDNGVSTIALESGGAIIVGGSFTTCDGMSVGRIARLQPDGALDLDFVAASGGGFDNNVQALARQPDGAILVGGGFSQYSGTPCANLARLHSDGSLDGTFDVSTSGLGANIRDVEVLGDGRIMVAGDGWSQTGVPAARLLANGLLDQSFAPGGPIVLYGVNSLGVLPDGRVILGGWGANVAGTARQGLACVSSDGALDPVDWTWRNHGIVEVVVPLAGGRWLVGGDFRRVDGVPHGSLACFNADWTLDPTFDVGSGCNGNIRSAVVQGDGRIVVGGNFTECDGIPRNNLVRLLPDGAVDPTFEMSTGPGVEGLALQRDGRILVSGWWYFAPGMSSQRFFARLLPDGSVDPTLDLGNDIPCVPMAMAVQDDDQLLVAGYPQDPGQSVFRLTREGAYDPNFTLAGAFSRDQGNFIAVQPDGRILFGGWSVPVRRLLADGSADEMFTATCDVVGSGTAFVQQTDGRLLVAGWMRDRDSMAWLGNVTRLNSDGSRDAGFALAGTMAAGVLAHSPVIAMEPDGCPILGGRVLTEEGEVSGVLRIEPAVPLILSQTPWQKVLPGNDATFTVQAIGPALDHQWQISTDGGGSWNDLGEGGDFTGTATSALTVLGVDATMSGHQFRCVVANALGSAASAPAALSLVSLPTVSSVAWVQGNGPLTSLGYASRTEPRIVASDAVAAFAGGQSSFFRKSDGTLWAMGANSYGQLGDGTTINRNLPVESLSGVTAVAGRWGHTLFLKADGTLWAAGNNANGALGDGTTIDRTVPVPIATGVLAVAAGFNHSLFVTADHTLWATGSNSNGQLGDGTLNSRNTPVAIATDVQAIAAAGNQSFYVTLDGRLFAMGLNANGQLGDGTTTDRSIPVQVATGVLTVAAAEIHTLWIMSDATLWSVGANGAGQLGDGTTTNRSTPAQVASGVSAIAAGGSGSLFIRSDDTLWGMGALWIPTPGGSPVQVATDVAAVAMAESHTMFSRIDGTLWTVGSNTFGQLGDGVAAPAQGWLADDVVAASVGQGTSLFITSGGTLWSQRGTTIAAVPGVNDAVAVAVGNYDVTRVFLRADGTLWKLSPPDDVPAWIADDVVSIGAGLDFIAFVKGDGTLWLQGRNWGVDYGDGVAPVRLDDHVVSFSVAGWHVLYVKPDHTLWALGGIWGSFGDWDWSAGDYNAMFLLHHSLPIQLESGVRSAVANKDQNLLLHDDGTLWTRGSNWNEAAVLVAADVSMADSDGGRSLYLAGDEILRARPGTQDPLGSETAIAGGVHSLAGSADGNSLFLQRAGFGVAPLVTTQPQSVAVPSGAAVALEIAVSGTGPLDYRWFKDGVEITWIRQAGLMLSSVTAADAGAYHCVIRNSAGSATTATATVTVLSTFAAFLQENFTPAERLDPAISGSDADPDGEGRGNLLEYAFATDPWLEDLDAAPTAVELDGDHLEFSFIRRKHAADLVYLPEASGDLDTWQSGPAFTAEVGVVDVDADLELVTVRDLTPLGAATRRFIRVRVTVMP